MVPDFSGVTKRPRPLTTFAPAIYCVTSVIFWTVGSIRPQVLATIAPVIAVVGLLQPLNAFVFIGDGILQGSQDFVYEVRGRNPPSAGRLRHALSLSLLVAHFPSSLPLSFLTSSGLPCSWPRTSL